MGAALRPGDRMDLVQDQGLDRPEVFACARGEQEVQRLRRRDQDVRRILEHRSALLLGRVAGADADPELRLEPGKRAAQVALDVVVERLERRDVEQAEARAGLAVEPVDAVEEGRKRLPRPRRCLDQRVCAGRDRRPAERLRRRRFREGPREPLARLRAEERERVHGRSVPMATRSTEPAISWKDRA